MNSGTFYLYEYENNKRRRNVGFIKVARHYRSCVLQIHAHGIPVGNGASLELYAFYRDDADLIAEQIAVLNCFRRNVSARLPIAESHFPEGRPLPQIDGFFIRLPGSRSTLFWMASAFFFDVDMGRLKIASEASVLSDTAKKIPALSDTASTREERPHITLPKSEEQLSPTDLLKSEKQLPSAALPASEETIPHTDTPGTEEAPPSENIRQPEETYSSPEILAAEDDSPEKDDSGSASEVAAKKIPEEPEEPLLVPASSQPSKHSEPAELSGQPSARKIQRSDIAQLPRRFWPLANNSFLLHGYHNYNHLMLIEEDGRTWLGVPGVYAPQEARAADLFGFSRFTRSCAAFPELTEEERSDSGDFGHWCRCVGTPRSR